MDKLQHIDDLLKASAQQLATDVVDDQDWLSIEKKLRRRKSRIYALRFFLALVLVSSSFILWQPFHSNPIATQDTLNKNIPSPELSEGTTVDHPVNPSITTENSLDMPESITPAAVEMPNDAPVPLPWVDHAPTLIQAPETEIPVVSNPTEIDEAVRNLANDVLDKSEIARNDVLLPEVEAGKETPIENQDIVANLDVTNDLDSTEPSAQKPETTDGSNNPPVRQAFIPYTEIGVAFTPGWSNKSTAENAAFAGLINRQYYQKVASSESAGFTNSAGIVAHRHLNRFLYVASGLYVSQRSESVNYNYLIDESPNVVEDPNGKRIEGYIPRLPSQYEQVNYNGSNSYHFIEIPVNLGYKQNISPKFELRGQVGVSYLHLLQTSGKKADYTYLQLSDLSDFSWNQHMLATNVRTGLYFNINKFVLGAEPSLSVSLNSLSDKNAAIKVKPYHYGFNLVAALKLNKK